VLSIVSHDLRNPLNTIGMAAALLLMEDIPPQKKDAQADAIRRSVEQMRRLIQDLLDASRVEAGGLAVDPRPCPAGEMVMAAVQLAAPHAEERAVALRTELQPLPPVLADRHRVLQVLCNLLNNAIAHTPAGGTVTVRVEPAAVEAGAGGAAALFSVEDSGCGIAAEDLPRVFDRFWQARRTGRGGAGLGLAIARGIVEAHGGQMGVRSTPGAGSTFWFTLPAVSGEGTA
jgi:signal transduction histidine kinase